MFLLIFSFLICNTLAVKVIDLTTNNWYLQNSKLNISYPITIPGSVHTCLLKNGYIDDPYKPFKDEKYAWIADKKWTIKTKFKGLKLNDQQHAFLTFDVVDTVCDIALNNKLVGKTDNMFVRYTFDVTDIVDIDNELVLKFQSPTLYAKNQYKNYLDKYNYKVPPVDLPEVQHGRDHQNFIRKEQCSFSWDWGPSFPTIGINGNVQLEVVDFLTIDHILVHTKFSQEKKSWDLTLEVIVNSLETVNATVVYGFDNTEEKITVNIDKGVGKVSLKSLQISDNKIKRWWPNGYGEQKLYQAHVKIINDASGKYASNRVNFGFRTVKLVQDLVADVGETGGREFYFEINGRPIFLKGANWIPADAFQERVSFSDLEGLLNDTVEANMNALRVWGGGIYEPNEFYELADKLGIMIWQDLMFAVALYPADKPFLKSVKIEILNQVRRLQHHPCLILWSGNNENEGAIAQQWWPEVLQYQKQLRRDYIKLYVDTIKPIIEKEDWSRPFVVSSPSNGIKSEEEGYLSPDPQNELYGDVHFYDYASDCWDTTMFPIPRMASEYGYQSYPSYITWSKIANDSQLIWDNALMMNRQHHEVGNQEIKNFIQQHFKLPISMEKSNEYFKDMIYLSQIVQATCIKYETEHYRRLQGHYDGFRGNTMGALYWQLNDIWQAPSWSSIEYGRRWKMLHYYAKHFFAPQGISGHITDIKLVVHGLLDRPEKQQMFNLKIKVYKWKSFKAIFTKSLTVKCRNASTEIFKEETTKVCPDEPCFAMLYLNDIKSNDVISSSVVFIGSFKNYDLEDPKLLINSVQQISSKIFRITLKASAPAAFVWLQSTFDGHFTDNGFVMDQYEMTVDFKSTHEVGIDLFKKSLQKQSLYDVYKK